MRGAQANVGEFDAILRQDFPSFVAKCFCELNGGIAYLRNWHIEAFAYQLERCRLGENKRLITTQPPRSLKSLIASIAWPAFILGHDPTKRVIGVSYSSDLAIKLARDFRQIVTSDWYRRIFPRTISTKDTETEFETSRGGGRLAVSIGGSITGRGGDYIIIDDPLKAEEALSKSAREKVNDYFRNTLYSRLNSKVTGVIVLVMQRLHEDDLAGRLLKQGCWVHLNLPAIATRDERITIGNGRSFDRQEGDVLHPAREPREALEQIQRTLGGRHFQAQYQQAPVPETGNLIRRDWLLYYDTSPTRTDTTRVIQSWDTAMKGEQIHDFSVCTTWLRHKGNHYLLDVVRRQCGYPALLELVIAQYRRHDPNGLLIEDKGSGTQLIQDLRHRAQISSIAIRPEGDKITRMDTASLGFEQGTVYLPREAPWLGDFLHELLLFPDAEFDDQVDSVSQYLIWDRRGQRLTFEVYWT
jgi:predicted phage terminase large subunit-like protein